MIIYQNIDLYVSFFLDNCIFIPTFIIFHCILHGNVSLPQRHSQCLIVLQIKPLYILTSPELLSFSQLPLCGVCGATVHPIRLPPTTTRVRVQGQWLLSAVNSPAQLPPFSRNTHMCSPTFPRNPLQ